ncbi:ABC transporter substrate-binding protein [Rhizobium sp. Root1203]|uniref:substrate-binding domain-containing protein n=1 Tax=Rhizobium sp. Root1203 TaxID=1736427 RepID=UPI000710C69D|nr:substrate-binding domain-containing protein [Rhizobium sp. Root1203]KQV12263.1 ABC transporter substrate-binding protein [Rhizobium sp. Root1203]
MRYTTILTGMLMLTTAGAAFAQEFNDPAEFKRQRDLLSMTAEGPAGQPWIQHLGGAMADTAKYKKEGAHTICFSNAGIFNPWRVVGMNNLTAEAELHKNEIKELIVLDAEGKDDKQISDIQSLVSGGKCDVLIVSPNTTAALTPAVEAACEKLPVIVFDRGVNSKCPVTYIHPVGGYGFGITSGEFIVSKVPKGANVLALRIVPGVDVLETRYSAAKTIFDEAGLKVIGSEFTGSDRAKTKAIVEDYINRGEKIDAVWMDAGDTATAALEAFEDAGQPYPVISGEDQQDFLRKWQKEKLVAIGPSYPTYQWRTPIIAALDILDGKPVPGPEWNLPQPAITQETLASYIDEKMPALHYSLCGCQELPGYPQRWGGK